MAKGKPIEAWAPKNPLGHLMLWAIAYRALDARAELVKAFSYERLTWPQLYRRGWRVVKVRVEEIG